MKCDYEALAELETKLNKYFNNMIEAMDNMEDANKAIYNSSNWSSVAKDYYQDEFKQMLTNFDNIVNKFMNIRQYLDQVINDYASLDRF